MRIVDPKALKEARERTRCEICGRGSNTGLDPMHYRACGLGGGHRLDHRLAVASGCRECHNQLHSGIRRTEEILEAIARRERIDKERVRQWLFDVARADKAGPIPPEPKP